MTPPHLCPGLACPSLAGTSRANASRATRASPIVHILKTMADHNVPEGAQEGYHVMRFVCGPPGVSPTFRLGLRVRRQPWVRRRDDIGHALCVVGGCRSVRTLTQGRGAATELHCGILASAAAAAPAPKRELVCRARGAHCDVSARPLGWRGGVCPWHGTSCGPRGGLSTAGVLEHALWAEESQPTQCCTPGVALSCRRSERG